MKVRVATRKSPLALWQANHVAQLLGAETPGLEVELITLTTQGDRILDQALSKVGGKDLFVKEIEEALLDGRADLAVHSLKDMPTLLPSELTICAFPPREDPRDAWVSSKGLALSALPERARIGTSSLRRAAQLLRRRPDLEILPIRGNVQTRLRKIDEMGLHGTVLAYAGLLRLGLASLATEVLDPSVCLPAIGQGVLAVETRIADRDVGKLVAALDDPRSRTAATAERAFLHRLRGGCQVPIAAHASVGDGGNLELRGLVASLDGSEIFEAILSGSSSIAAQVGVALAEQLLEAGAGRVLDAILEPR